MPRFRIVATVASLAAVVAIAASAQDERRVRVQVEEPQANENRAVPDVDATAKEDEAGFYRASEVIGTQVRGDDGQSLGRIEDLLIEGKSQQIRYFILSEGGQVDANANVRTPAAQSSSNVTVVPWSVARPQFGRTPDSRVVTVPFAQTRLREAPTYTWQEIQTAPTRWVPDVNRFYNVRGGGVAVPPDSRVRIQRDGDVKIKQDND